MPSQPRPAEGAPFLFAGAYLLIPISLSIIVLAKVPEANWEKALRSLAEFFGPIAVGGIWVYRARTRSQMISRGALVGLIAGVVSLVATYFQTRHIQHDDVLPLALMMMTVVLPVGGAVLGVVCAAIAGFIATSRR